MATTKTTYYVEFKDNDGNVQRDTGMPCMTIKDAARFGSYYPVSAQELCHLSSPARFVGNVIDAYESLVKNACTGCWTVVEGMSDKSMLVRIAKEEK